MSIDSNFAIICLTENGKNLAISIQKHFLNSHIYVINKSNLIEVPQNIENITETDEKLSILVNEIFKKYQNILFIMATGIVVRAIAPLVQSKFSDPAILVADEKGKNVISLLSGHIGGANELTVKISEVINANPVITTATDINHKSSLDNIAKSIDGYIEDFRDKVKDINSMLVHNKRIGIYIDGEYQVDTRGFEIIKGIDDIDDFDKVVVISDKLGFENKKIIKVIPRDIVLGIGCRRNTYSEYLEECVNDFLKNNNIDINSVKKIGSIDIKFDEEAIVNLAKKLDVEFKLISSEKISEIEDLFDKSEFVKKQVGVYNVSEPVAYILSNKNVIVKKTKYKGITISMGRIQK